MESRIQIWLSTLLQLYDKLIFKHEINYEINHETKSINKILFIDMMPLLRVWLEPLPPTAVMQELKQFQKDFNDCSDNQQLLIISQMMSLRTSSIKTQVCNHIHLSIRASIFLTIYQEEIKFLGQRTIKQYYSYVSQLTRILNPLTIDSMLDLVIVMIQISQQSITERMNAIYDSIIDNIVVYNFPYEKRQLLWESQQSILPLAERDILIAEMNNSPCPITRQVMVLHLQLERQMILYLWQQKEQLYQKIEMQLELEVLIQYRLAYL